ncbi:MAG: glycosyltransferase family 2 protein [Nitrososphaerota archaeon]|nr:glycosyltransferase family 2 protein [Nitrososphaerota archaeon]
MTKILQHQQTVQLQLIIPALNEEAGIGLTISEMQQFLVNLPILVIDGQSTDRTIEIAKSLGAKIARQNGKGKGDALAKAFECMAPQVKYAILTDADYTYPAEYVPQMIQVLEEKPEVGMVCGNRFSGNVDPKALRKVFSFGNRLIAWSHRNLNGVQLKDPLTGLRVIRAEILRNWQIKSKGFDIEVELNRHVEKHGFDIKEIDIHYRQRLGEKKLKVRDGVTILKRIILEA